MRVHVAVGVIFNSEKDKILIAKRADHQHQGGLWEFPGGKVEQGETVQHALQRELWEELALTCEPDRMQRLISIPFHYSDKSVLLDVWSIFDGEMPEVNANQSSADSSELIGKEGQPLAWVEVAALADYEFPAANKGIIDALLLPKKIAITQDSTDPAALLIDVAQLLKNHRDVWIQLRAPSLDQQQYTQLAMQLYGMCHEAGSKLIWNCPLNWYQIAFADGLHLSRSHWQAAMASHPADKRFIPSSQWLSSACHSADELETIQEGIEGNIDYLLVSPVKQTATHPHAPILGWQRFKDLTDAARLPCYALGGLSLDDLTDAQQQGAQGIAGIRGFK